MADTIYAVVDTRADQGPAWLPDDQFVALFGDIGNAVEHRDTMQKERGAEDGAFRVYRMEPLPETQHWDWAVDHGTGHGPMQYVNERAARNCVGDGRLLRRRAGGSGWEPVAAVPRCPRCGVHRDLHPKWAVCPPCVVAEGWEVA